MPGTVRSNSLPTEDQAVCDQDVYSLFGDSVDATPVVPQQPISNSNNRLPRITVILRPESRQLPLDRQTRRSAVSFDERRRRTLLSTESETPFGGGICRQLAAMYTDVGMTTVERVRWLCGWMVLIYAITCCAWFAWSAYTVPLVGILTGTVGLLACQRPHEQDYMTYVLAFLALNYAQLALLVWTVFIALPAEITGTCSSNCAARQAKAVFIVLLVVATGIFHWRVATITRKYVCEFRMIQQLTMRSSQRYLYASYSRAAVSATMATEIQSRSLTSEVSVGVAGDLEHPVAVYAVPYRADYIQSARM
ncbi:hypothetical protein P3T76_013178 [Phytophthora citrophthora]|uniref:Transmembrane protein n=1 Tax=Phytophthora citrophthora TaxID=4793 RepID=A0AAD9G4P8_9STRA|nr:hypothetical protein P3T76_013178 [Phytophthora citrophthora]